QVTEENNSDNEPEPPGNLIVKISPHLRSLAKKYPEIKRQFYPSPEEDKPSEKCFLDPLVEEDYLKTKGLYHKYPRRVLILLTLACASYCRFCTRKRRISELKEAQLNKKDLTNIVNYLKKHSEINEAIFSGGDPFMSPEMLILAVKKISRLSQIKIIRIHTRVPVSNPKLVKKDLLDALGTIKKQVLYISLHFEHPAEITPATIKIINDLKRAGAILLSQSVFLAKVNDRFETLAELFTRLSELGVRPYYIFHCDPVIGSEHFIVPLKKEIKIMTRLRKELSGIACPTFVIDTPNGSGKIPVPLDFWKFEKRSFTDYNNKKIKVID
ncbi:MAG: KamA family radical SAM protein, partial [Microgenomates group bacterium]